LADLSAKINLSESLDRIEKYRYVKSHLYKHHGGPLLRARHYIRHTSISFDGILQGQWISTSLALADGKVYARFLAHGLDYIIDRHLAYLTILVGGWGRKDTAEPCTIHSQSSKGEVRPCPRICG
jgi:hypothetical protein